MTRLAIASSLAAMIVMKIYGNDQNASMDMRSDPLLVKSMSEIIAARKIDVVIETGTFLGLGSTKLIAESFHKGAPPRRFVTIEVNFANWCRAKANLRPYCFVEARWGRSVPMERAVNFLRSDELLINRNQNKYSHIYIDNMVDPVAAYARELQGDAIELERQPLGAKGSDIRFEGKDYLFDGEDLLARLLTVHARHMPLIVLDSAGGIGFLEFQIVMEKMSDKPFHLLLDDINHVKHFRSFEYVRHSPKFDIFAHTRSWALATHRA